MVGRDNLPIKRIEAQVLIHATEDPDRVLKALDRIFQGTDEDFKIEKTGLEGFHRNTIILIKAATDNASVAQNFLSKTLPKLPERDKALLASELDRHLEGGTLHLRLDKQAAYVDRIELGASDPIRVALKFRGHKPTADDARRILSNYGIIVEK